MALKMLFISVCYLTAFALMFFSRHVQVGRINYTYLWPFNFLLQIPNINSLNDDDSQGKDFNNATRRDEERPYRPYFNKSIQYGYHDPLEAITMERREEYNTHSEDVEEVIAKTRI
ncbi:unnamed protein product [Toxocara canis]|uniref:Uncharacterized protein n=1 Tax=Toxocara canis TaxID=6265 RepID=A0A183VAX4_TOXCA|nr:unnamed protein product [Toxocara canis]